MRCGQAEQPLCLGLRFLLIDPEAKNRMDFLAQQRRAIGPPLVGVARAA